MDDAKRRIDLLCLDHAANLVVVELKLDPRTEGTWNYKPCGMRLWSLG